MDTRHKALTAAIALSAALSPHCRTCLGGTTHHTRRCPSCPQKAAEAQVTTAISDQATLNAHCLMGRPNEGCPNG